MGWERTIANLFKRGAVVLAVMALALRVMTPAGFMLTPAAGDHGLPQLVICTGHGPLLTGSDRKSPSDTPQKQDGGHTCVFASAHAPAAAPETFAAAEPAFAPLDFAPVTGRPDQRPGLGLAAPPPPSRGPPTSLI